jgi:hypothetical protein
MKMSAHYITRMLYVSRDLLKAGKDYQVLGDRNVLFRDLCAVNRKLERLLSDVCGGVGDSGEIEKPIKRGGRTWRETKSTEKKTQ